MREHDPPPVPNAPCYGCGKMDHAVGIGRVAAELLCLRQKLKEAREDIETMRPLLAKIPPT